MQGVPIHIDYKGKHLEGYADPILNDTEKKVPFAFDVYLDKKYLGIIKCNKDKWVLDNPADPELVDTIGSYIHAWYE